MILILRLLTLELLSTITNIIIVVNSAVASNATELALGHPLPCHTFVHHWLHHLLAIRVLI